VASHNPEVVGSNPTPATRESPAQAGFSRSTVRRRRTIWGPIGVQGAGSGIGWRFEARVALGPAKHRSSRVPQPSPEQNGCLVSRFLKKAPTLLVVIDLAAFTWSPTSQSDPLTALTSERSRGSSPPSAAPAAYPSRSAITWRCFIRSSSSPSSAGGLERIPSSEPRSRRASAARRFASSPLRKWRRCWPPSPTTARLGRGPALSDRRDDRAAPGRAAGAALAGR
jgi:hypothetical protein